MTKRRFSANLAFMGVQVAEGGGERFESVANALKLVKPEAEFIAIHDAVRPCVTIQLTRVPDPSVRIPLLGPPQTHQRSRQNLIVGTRRVAPANAIH